MFDPINLKGGVDSMLLKHKSANSSGFTLIELLIVIVIIGILAGVLIAVIDPSKQSNRARDAGVQAAINKVALATEGYVSAYGVAPDEVDFISSLQNVTEYNNSCQTSNSYTCMFGVQGNTLPMTCSSDWRGSGTQQCYYYYYSNTGDTDNTDFELYAKSYGRPTKVFRYSNKVGVMEVCDTTANLPSVTSSCTSEQN